MSFDASLSRMNAFLGISMDGELMTVAKYSSKESIGVSLLVATSCLSLVAVLGLLILMGVAAWLNRTSESKNYFFRTNVAAYFICLLVADLIQALASIMNARWVQFGGVQRGQFCTAQGVLKHLSDIGSASWSFVISAQTFCLLFYQLHSPRWVGWVVLGLANGLMVMLIFLGPAVYRTKADGDFYGISGYWCWITPEYNLGRVTLDYMILFLSAFLSFILYTLVFFRLRGNIVVTGWHVRFRMLEKDESGWRGRERANSRALSIARQMILYPVAYTILFLPIAVLRLCEWTGQPVSFAVMMFCDSIFLLGGVINVVLFCTIRRVIPIKEVAVALFTGKAFRKQEVSSTDTTWCIGSLKADEERISTNLSLPTNDDYFILRQPKFEIVTPLPAVLPDKTATPMTAQFIQPVPMFGTEAVVHADPSPRSPIPRTRSISRRPLPVEPSIYSEDSEEYDRSSSFSRQSSIRRLPPIPQGSRPAALPPIVEKRDSPPPSYRSITTHTRQCSASSSVPSHSHSASLDSVTSGSSISGSTLLGSADKDSSKDDDFPSQK
ncbi:hypothetical protein BDM02DRAFT_3183333 [Thelephora ganbajun]|uniref:Uncharacterized protein n=1 Tax=Thelephora ganbajun TaxID=370292 RepID=A0ACB6ZTR7_THEGA|nr:hypothetical protein BDM02DRAFT_3183333 [Thelephora ganbajun]